MEFILTSIEDFKFLWENQRAVAVTFLVVFTMVTLFVLPFIALFIVFPLFSLFMNLTVGRSKTPPPAVRSNSPEWKHLDDINPSIPHSRQKELTHPVDEDGTPILDMSIYEGKGYTLGFDTNVLIDYGPILEDIPKSVPVLISKQVMKELDRKKKDEELGFFSRRASSCIERLQTNGNSVKFTTVTDEFLKKHKLDPSDPDDRIIGSYLKIQQEGSRNVLFISRDRNARIAARNAGLTVLDINQFIHRAN
ncbi:hypothetical protein J2S74_003035 [Evansella vedderi]|uniref:PIN domain-containing protein n=1 Tax=Evansella vedderi TaxID=38282 RepID=A0ABT9ZYZ0_9BACI|nr:PIN domain-containing protein [Evansella vedderi]MDQ0255653.1 hypothetical protein [Evansella vedderi]